MPRFLLQHRHAPGECRAAFAAWNGFSSPLRKQPATSSCLVGRHELWWAVDADDEQAALAQLPAYVAERTEAIRVTCARVP